MLLAKYNFFGLIFFISFEFFAVVFVSDTVPNNAPTSTIDPSFEMIDDNIPLTGDGTSKLTLSVSSSTIGSSASTVSPVFFKMK